MVTPAFHIGIDGRLSIRAFFFPLSRLTSYVQSRQGVTSESSLLKKCNVQVLQCFLAQHNIIIIALL